MVRILEYFGIHGKSAPYFGRKYFFALRSALEQILLAKLRRPRIQQLVRALATRD